MTKLCLLLPFLSLLISDAFSQQYGKRDAIIRQCEAQYGGEVQFGQQITKTINGVAHVCYQDVKCVEQDDSGHIDILQKLNNACVAKSVLDKEKADLNRRLFLGGQEPNCLYGNTKGINCGNGNVEIGGGLVVGSSIPAQCSKKYRKFLRARNKYFSKGNGGGFLIFVRSREKRYASAKKKLQECLFSYNGASCINSASINPKSSCFKGMAGISVGPGNQVIFSGGTGSSDCAVGGGCISNAELDLILSDYDEEDCDDCNSRKARRAERRANRRANGGGNAAGILGAILNPLAYFGSNYFGAKFAADAASAGAEACATAYGSYSGSIDLINNNIGSENANVRAPGNLPLVDYRDPRTPRCNGHNMGAFTGLGGSFFGGNAFQGGLGFNPMFGQSYMGFGQGLNMMNHYGGIGGMFGLNVGIDGQVPGAQFGFGSPWAQGGFYQPGAAGWMAGANGHMPYGGMYGGVPGGNPYGVGGAFGAGGGAWGQPGFGGGFGMSQRNFQNPQGSFFQSQLQAQARMRDAQYYGNRAFGGPGMGMGMYGAGGFGSMPFPNTPYATPPFAPYR